MVNMKKKVKAQRYWRTPNSLRIYGTKKTAKYYSGFAADKVAPVYVLPADAASVEAMVEQMARAMVNYPMFAPTFSELSRAALAAIGIKGGAK